MEQWNGTAGCAAFRILCSDNLPILGENRVLSNSVKTTTTRKLQKKIINWLNKGPAGPTLLSGYDFE